MLVAICNLLEERKKRKVALIEVVGFLTIVAMIRKIVSEFVIRWEQFDNCSDIVLAGRGG